MSTLHRHPRQDRRNVKRAAVKAHAGNASVGTSIYVAPSPHKTTRAESTAIERAKKRNTVKG